MRPTREALLEDETLRGYLSWLMQARGPSVAFVVLYGSRARGTSKSRSDYDVLIGLEAEDGLRFIDRLLLYNEWDHFAAVEAKAYTPSEIENLWLHLGRTMLDALHEGVVLSDRGPWKHWQDRFHHLLDARALDRDGTTWIWHPERDPDANLRRKHCLTLDRAGR